MRLTKKYFRDKVNENFFAALSILPTIVFKYGKNPKGHRKMKSIQVPGPDSWWNHYITDFYFSNGKLFANVYWQGDSTDGDSPIQIIPGRTNYRIPAQYYDDGYRTRTIHGDLQIDSNELHATIKRLVNSL